MKRYNIPCKESVEEIEKALIKEIAKAVSLKKLDKRFAKHLLNEMKK